MTRPRAIVSWSGGKDSCLALMRAASTYDVRAMITMFDEHGTRSRSHGLRPEIVAAQAERLGLRPIAAFCSWATYEEAFVGGLAGLAGDGFTHIIFGDIFEDAHRTWTERVAARAGLIAVQPLWDESTAALTREFLTRGGEAVFVTTRDEWLDRAWLGRPLTAEAIDAFALLGVDAGGERGEYHTVVTNCPLFLTPLALEYGDVVQRSGCSAIDLRLASAAVSR